MIHWHLVTNEWSLADKTRFDTERANRERMVAPAGVARSVEEAVAWHLDVRRQLMQAHRLADDVDWELKGAVMTRLAEAGRDVLDLVAIGMRTVHISAYVSTDPCHRHPGLD